MCTMIVETADVAGMGKSLKGWFKLQQVAVSYDHPFHVPLEHAVNIDFWDTDQGSDARVAVELTPESARSLLRALEATLGRAEAYSSSS